MKVRMFYGVYNNIDDGSNDNDDGEWWLWSMRVVVLNSRRSGWRRWVCCMLW